MTAMVFGRIASLQEKPKNEKEPFSPSPPSTPT